MTDEYAPLGGDLGVGSGDDDLDSVEARFSAAAEPFLISPLPWLTWAFVLPAAALATPAVVAAGGLPAGLLLWSIAILLGGATEALTLWSRRRGRGGEGARAAATPLARWVLRAQANLSLVGLALSVALLVLDAPSVLPGLWLLLVGHSVFTHGGLAFRPFRRYGLWLQAGGVVALLGIAPLPVFAIATGTGNAWMAWCVWRAGATRR